MTSLASLLQDPAALLRHVSVKAPEPIAIRREAAAIAGQVSAAPDAERTADLQLRVAEQIRREGAAAVSRRDLRHSCRTFLHSPHPPAASPDVGEAIIARVSATHRRAGFFALLDCYLDSYDVDDPNVSRLAGWLRDVAWSWPWRPGDPWRERLRRYDLLNGAVAAERIAKAVLGSADGPDPVLRTAGLDIGGRSRGGLAEAAFRATCRKVGALSGRQAEDAQRVLLDWAQPRAGESAFPRSWVELVKACILPWSDCDPDEEHREYLLDRLERLGGGDPRIPGRGAWPRVSEQAPDAYGVILRWLTRASVMQFLGVVDRSMRDEGSRRMWSYRRAFWTSYLLNKSGPRIERAWVAFGADGADLAKRAAKETGDRSLSVFGRQSEKSGQHAALILEIGDLLIVDWSHSAKYNVWRRGERGPSLFRLTYGDGELDSAPLRESHVSPATYTWQRRLAQIIEGRHFFTEKPEWRPSRV